MIGWITTLICLLSVCIFAGSAVEKKQVSDIEILLKKRRFENILAGISFILVLALAILIGLA